MDTERRFVEKLIKKSYLRSYSLSEMRLTLQRNGNILITVDGNIDPIQLNIGVQL